MPPRKILLATDLSCRCDRALDRAAALAVEWGAQIVILHAIQRTETAGNIPSWWRRPLDPREVALRRVRDDLPGNVDVQSVVEYAEPAPLILKTARQLGCELIVTGVVREETLGRAALGTTIEKVVRQAEVPVLVVNSRPRGSYRSVVVATDFSDASRAALESALALLPAARMSLFHAFEFPFDGFIDDKMAMRDAGARQAAAESQAFLNATPAVARSRRTIEKICEYGVPEWLLSDLAERGDADLVALGTVGRTGLANMLIGSIAQRLITRLPVDMLVVRQPGVRAREASSD